MRQAMQENLKQGIGEVQDLYSYQKNVNNVDYASQFAQMMQFL